MTSIIAKQTQAAEEEWLEYWKSGPQRMRWTEAPLQVGDPAPDFRLNDSSGEWRELSRFWTEKPALILFWRHYGCGCGMDRSSKLGMEMEGYENAGANVLIIGQGEPERSAAYAEKYHLPAIPVLSDPEYRVYKAFGLVEGKPSQILFDAPEEFLTLDLEIGLKFAEERRNDDRPPVDNPWLLPGEFIINTNGLVSLAYRYNYCEDFPDQRVLLAGIREAQDEARGAHK